MGNRLQLRIQYALRNRTKLFCAFVTLGYPNLAGTERLIEAFDQEGVDIIELGFPFSDPLADGPMIQYSSEAALRRGVHFEDALRLVKRLRAKGIQIPILFFSYLNPILHFGAKRAAARLAQAGFDGLIVPDLPPEEESEFQRACRRQGLAQAFLVAPTTEKKRALQIVKNSRGFIYYVSVRGVTGARRSLPRDIRRHLKTLKRLSRKPFLIGFGVSSPEQAKDLARLGHGVIVGSALIDRIRRAGGKTELAIRFIRKMVRAVKGPNS